MGPRPVIYGLVAGLVALALALPTGAAAAERTLTVHLAGAGEGWVECEVEGVGPETCEATYPSGTELRLVPEAELESEFAGFSAGTGSAAGCSGTAPCSFTLSADSAVTATFVPEALPEFTLTVKKSGSGTGTVECQVEGGTPGPCAAGYPEGAWVTLIETPGAESEFVHWTGACSEYEELEECELTMEGPRSATATFNLWPALTIHVSGTGSGTVTCEAQEGEEPCAARYPKWTELTVRGMANSGSFFAGFSAGTGSATSCSGTSPCDFTMEANSKVAATFSFGGPTVSGVSPSKGATTGGTVVTIAGTNLAGATAVKFGTTAAAGYEVKSATEIKATSPSHGAGEVDVTVTTPGGTSATGPNDQFKFEAPVAGGGGRGSTPTPTPVPTPVPGIATAAGTAQVKGGKAALKLSCSGGPCTGSITLTAKFKRGGKTKSRAIGRASFDFAAGASIVLKVKLSTASTKELERGGGLKAKVTGTGVASSTIKLKLSGGVGKHR